ncbi:MAG: DNA mismatch repair endonuclease MutL [Elusimicrobia bacterium]|nr:DNA mismatch repair endonuclease MutL [Elusimicrobiota bacterium]
MIERPASALKELIENSLDAGAARVEVSVEGAGRKLLRVRDDGCGMEPADCRAAFERHATSKISDLDDLEGLSTFGFRGEALYSIAAVARVSLTSCRPGSKCGFAVEAEGGRIVREREAPPIPGAAVEVRDIFHNVPARLKFLRSEASEKARLARVVEDAALANPSVAFIFKTGPRATLEYPAERAAEEGERLRARLGEVLGEELAASLLYAETRRGGVLLRAFISPAEKLVATRQLQYVFVNRRPVSCRTIQQALYRSYEPFRAQSRHPVAIVFAEVPSGDLDVNVHPQKREVRFRREGEVFEAVVSALSGALLASKSGSGLDIGHSTAVPYPQAPGAGSVCERGAGRDAQPSIAFEPAASGPRWHRPPLRFLGQIERTYLVFEAAGGLLVLDQHAAQERILFERYSEQLRSRRPAKQKLMLPLPVKLPASAVEQVLARRQRLSDAGFEVERFGKTSVQVTAVPELFEKAADVEEIIHRALEHFISPAAAKADARYDAAATIACKAAVKAHDPLGEREALALADDLRACRDSTCCPHGRPAVLDMGREELARRFGRSGPPPT